MRAKPPVVVKKLRTATGGAVRPGTAERSTRRWKLVCGVLAAMTAHSWMREPAAAFTSSPAATSRFAKRGQLRIDARALGVSTRELVGQILSARNAEDMRPAAAKLAIAGDDGVVDALRPLIEDTRPGVPELVIDLYGRIGTEHAVTILGELLERRASLASSAVTALGESRHPRAETLVIGYIETHKTYEAIHALAKFETDTAVAMLAQLADTTADDVQRYVLDTLGTIRTPAARRALRELIDSPSVTTATRALDALQDVDDETVAVLTALIASGDSELGRSAVAALGRAGDAGGPVLIDIALDSAADLRVVAVRALAGVKTPAAFEALAKIVETAEGELGEAALAAIAAHETAQARELLISVALDEGSLSYAALQTLSDLQGADIDEALRVIAKSDGNTGFSALAFLLDRDHPAALAMVVAKAGVGEDSERMAALDLLAKNGKPAAIAKVLDLVRGATGSLQVRALGMLATELKGNPEVAALLRDSLRSSTPGLAAAAAEALGTMGTDEARDALVGALATREEDVLYAAVRGLDAYRLDDTTAAALARAGEENVAITSIVMRKLLATGSEHGIRLAQKAINDENPSVAASALESLRGLGNKAARQVIEEAVHTTDGDVRMVAVRALGDTRDPQAVDVLTSALDDSNPAVRESVAYALRANGSDKARAALVNMTRSPDADDRVAAINNLRDADDRTAQQRIKEMLRDPAPRVVEYAIYAMATTDTGATELRRAVLDGGLPQQTRFDAARALASYNALDERTVEWLEANSPEPELHYMDE